MLTWLMFRLYAKSIFLIVNAIKYLISTALIQRVLKVKKN